MFLVMSRCSSSRLPRRLTSLLLLPLSDRVWRDERTKHSEENHIMKSRINVLDKWFGMRGGFATLNQTPFPETNDERDIRKMQRRRRRGEGGGEGVKEGENRSGY